MVKFSWHVYWENRTYRLKSLICKGVLQEGRLLEGSYEKRRTEACPTTTNLVPTQKRRALEKAVCITTYSSLAPFSSSSHSGLNRNFSWQQRRGAFFILSGGEFPLGYL